MWRNGRTKARCRQVEIAAQGVECSQAHAVLRHQRLGLLDMVGIVNIKNIKASVGGARDKDPPSLCIE
jgi:hypothetical protein